MCRCRYVLVMHGWRGAVAAGPGSMFRLSAAREYRHFGLLAAYLCEL